MLVYFVVNVNILMEKRPNLPRAMSAIANQSLPKEFINLTVYDNQPVIAPRPEMGYRQDTEEKLRLEHRFEHESPFSRLVGDKDMTSTSIESLDSEQSDIDSEQSDKVRFVKSGKLESVLPLPRRNTAPIIEVTPAGHESHWTVETKKRAQSHSILKKSSTSNFHANLAEFSIRSGSGSSFASSHSGHSVIFALPLPRDTSDSLKPLTRESSLDFGQMEIIDEKTEFEGNEEKIPLNLEFDNESGIFHLEKHELFIELDELYAPASCIDGMKQWRQICRWIKYEETIEEGSNRFGKPHIPSLLFHSMLELRHCLKYSLVGLDLEAKDLRHLMEQLIEELYKEGHIRYDDRERVFDALMRRRRHVNIRKSTTGRLTHHKLVPWWHHKKSRADFGDPELVKRLPVGCEGASVMVGSMSILERPAIAFVRLKRPVQFPHLLEVPLPVRFVFVMLGPLSVAVDYQEVGRGFGSILTNKEFRDAMYDITDKDGLLEAFHQVMDDSILFPPIHPEKDSLVPYAQIKRAYTKVQDRRRSVTTMPPDLEEFLNEEVHRVIHDPLRKTGVPFGGLRRECMQRFPLYLSDFTDACNMKCVTSVFFIFLMCFFPALTFGAILAEESNGMIGVKETLLATSIGGAIFALTSTQPLLVIGVSGPMLIFELSLINFCAINNLNFLQVRFWLSLWALGYSIIIVAMEGPYLVKYITSFTDDILTALISVIFISDCFHFMVDMFHHHPLLTLPEYCVQQSAMNNSTILNEDIPSNDTHSLISQSLQNHHHQYSVHHSAQPNTALLSCVLVIGTCLTSLVLKNFSRSKYFGRKIRNTLGDIGPTIAIIVMALIDVYLFHDVNVTEKLFIKRGFGPSDRSGWIINPWPVPRWVPALSALAGLLLFMILFCETEVCEMILARKEGELRKGTGYHWDLVLSGLLLVVSSLFGMPWLVTAPVRSVTHAHSLTHYKLQAPGQNPMAYGVIEQRVTALVLHIMIGLTLLATDLLTKIPMALLFGVFLYMGIVNMVDVPMLSRFVLFFVPVKYHPDTMYCLRVRTWRMHLYSIIQLGCCIFVGAIKSFKTTAFAFPLAILVAIMIRFLVLPKIFSEFELWALDCEEEEVKSKTESMDLYQQTRFFRATSVNRSHLTSTTSAA